ncbi:hypothetical protein LINPERHAP1_LOCUS30339, partial [Linum perenne]
MRGRDRTSRFLNLWSEALSVREGRATFLEKESLFIRVSRSCFEPRLLVRRVVL